MLDLGEGNILIWAQAENVGDDVDGDGAEDDTPAGGENNDDTTSNCDGENITISNCGNCDHCEIESTEEGTDLFVTFCIQECLDFEKKEPASNGEYRDAEKTSNCESRSLIIIDSNQEPIGRIEVVLIKNGFWESVSVLTVVEDHFQWENKAAYHDCHQEIREELHMVSFQLTVVVIPSCLKLYVESRNWADNQKD